MKGSSEKNYLFFILDFFPFLNKKHLMSIVRFSMAISYNCAGMEEGRLSANRKIDVASYVIPHTQMHILKNIFDAFM